MPECRIHFNPLYLSKDYEDEERRDVAKMKLSHRSGRVYQFGVHSLDHFPDHGAHSIGVAGAGLGVAASYMGVAGAGTGLDAQRDIPDHEYIPRRRRRGFLLAATTVVLCVVGILNMLTCWRSTPLDPYQLQVWPQVWPCGAYHIPDITATHQ